MGEALELVGQKAPAGANWAYPVHDEAYRCFVGHLPGALSANIAEEFFGIVNAGVQWEQTGPRWTAWMVDPPCNCPYGYGGFEVKPIPFPPWMHDIMSKCMPL